MVVTFLTVFWNALAVNSSPVTHLGNLLASSELVLSLGDVTSEGESILFCRDTGVWVVYEIECAKYKYGVEHCLFKYLLIDLLNL